MSANVEYVLGVILKKEIALKNDEIAELAENVVNDHFNKNPKEMLEANQINRFTGIAYSSNTPEDVKKFIQSQASKGRKGWIEEELDKRLIAEIDKIKGDDATEVYEDTLTKVGEYTEEDIAKRFNRKKKKEFIRNIAIELRREFATDFGIYYIYKRRE